MLICDFKAAVPDPVKRTEQISKFTLATPVCLQWKRDSTTLLCVSGNRALIFGSRSTTDSPISSYGSDIADACWTEKSFITCLHKNGSITFHNDSLGDPIATTPRPSELDEDEWKGSVCNTPCYFPHAFSIGYFVDFFAADTLVVGYRDENETAKYGIKLYSVSDTVRGWI